MQCGFWEFGALVRHAKLRYEAGLGTDARRRRAFDVPGFPTTGTGLLDPPAELPDALAQAENAAKAKGWIDRSGDLNDQWGEIVTTLARGSDCGFLLVKNPDFEEVRVLVSVRRGRAFRIALRGDAVDIDEVPARSPWFALTPFLPEAEPAQGKAMTVPASVLTAASAEAEQHRGDQSEWAAYELQLRRIPAITAKVIGAWTKRADPVTARINVAIREPDGSLRVGPFAINVHRAPSGRVAVFPRLPLGQETTVAPGSSGVIANTMQHYVDDLRLRADVDRER